MNNGTDPLSSEATVRPPPTNNCRCVISFHKLRPSRVDSTGDQRVSGLCVRDDQPVDSCWFQTLLSAPISVMGQNGATSEPISAGPMSLRTDSQREAALQMDASTSVRAIVFCADVLH